MAHTPSAWLKARMLARDPVRLSTRFRGGWLHGYVLDVGPRFIPLSVVIDSFRFDGFLCCRIGDLKDGEHEPCPEFVEAALKSRGLRRPRKPRIDLTSTASLLQTAGRAFPLVTIALEGINRGASQIGVVERVSRARLDLLEIGPDADWEADTTPYRLADITRVEVGGSYEESLWMVGGPPVRPASRSNPVRQSSLESQATRAKNVVKRTRTRRKT